MRMKLWLCLALILSVGGYVVLSPSAQVLTGSGGGPTGATGPTGPAGAAGTNLTASCAGTATNVLYLCETTITPTQMATMFSAPVEVVAGTPNKWMLPVAAAWQNKLASGVQYGFNDVYLGPTGLVGTAKSTNWFHDPSDVTTDAFEVIVSMVSQLRAASVADLAGPFRVSALNGAGLSVSISDTDNAAGTIGTVTCPTVGQGGTGYAPGDTFTVDGNFGSNSAVGVVDTAPGGVVTLCHLTNGGTGYRVGTGNTTTHTSGGGDDGLQIDINTLSAFDNIQMRWTILYKVVDVF